jgi:hypothetical protein
MDASALGKHFRSNVVGYIALFAFAIGGTAEALPGLGSVDSGDIKNGQVKRRDLAPGLLAGIAGPVGPRGAHGAIGPQGPEGARSPAGAIAAGSVTATELADGSVTNPKLADDAVTVAKIAASAVGSSEVANNSLTGSDLKGADVNGGGISVPTGYVPNGRCRQVDASVGGAEAGQAVLFSVQGALQDGVMIYGQRVPSDGHVTFDVCNFSGTTQTAVSDLPVHVLTFE